MTVIRNLSHGTYETTYLPTVVFFCAITCTTIMMLKFRGFKASFNLLSRKKGDREHYDKGPDMPVLGAYRSNREEYFGNNNPITPRKITPSMVKLPQTSPSKLHSSKSSGDLSKLNMEHKVDLLENSRKSTSDIPASSREHKQSKKIQKQDKVQLKLEKQKLAEQKKREKMAHEQEKQKLKREKNKHEIPQKQLKPEIMEKTAKKKPPAPQPPDNSLSQSPVQHFSNTLESSISRSSGPPPYTEVPEVVPNQNDNTGNTSFAKPIEGPSSWDLISQHRQQLNRPLKSQNPMTKSTVLDLHYNVVNVKTSIEDRDNSEA